MHLRRVHFFFGIMVLHVHLCSEFGLSSAFSGGSFLERNDSPSFSDLLSSPESYASALNMTINEVVETKRIHKDASDQLFRKLKFSNLPGKTKHIMQCKHRYRHGHHPFVCDQCWSYAPVCICDRMLPKHSLPNNLELVLWLHHGEWGLTSNTGCILAQTLTPCTMLMKGLPHHDGEMEALLNDTDVLSVVLWPSNSGTRDFAPGTITIDQMKARLAKQGQHQRVVLIALDSTWRNARRMVSRLPESVFRLDLPERVVFPEGCNDVSIISPLRTRGPGVSNRQVCTAEAVVRALVALGLSEKEGERVLNVAEAKVDLIRRYRGKPLR
eukprot:CAMPEP_0113575946 /NCGR_PEP_ID=MMETSP0015_2-20120614/27998_1 /TAXON_ID=2838 /ORGANISM="Odontella" /LENGTH=326 /DNA_ID=CAMNT_0000479277 /DNA_START=111 /DNA_END=1091 /DNA_ORIENTATION=+ /assembly_acc=CAM_ASM_000160